MEFYFLEQEIGQYLLTKSKDALMLTLTKFVPYLMISFILTNCQLG